MSTLTATIKPPDRVPRKPSRTALAARSLLAIDRMQEGSPERREALRVHRETFAVRIRPPDHALRNCAP